MTWFKKKLHICSITKYVLYLLSKEFIYNTYDTDFEIEINICPCIERDTYKTQVHSDIYMVSLVLFVDLSVSERRVLVSPNAAINILIPSSGSVSLVVLYDWTHTCYDAYRFLFYCSFCQHIMCLFPAAFCLICEMLWNREKEFW